MTAQRAIENEIGTPDGWETTIYGSVATDADRQYVDDKYNQNIFDLYVKYLNASDITPSSGYVSGEYYKQAKFLNGEKQGNSAVSEPWSLFARVMQLKDGTIIQLIFTNLAGGVVWSAYPHLAVFVIDINGLSGPNVVGKDIFLLMLDKKINNALAPLSGRLNGGDTTCDKTSKGYACLKRVIDDGWKITYY